MKQRVLEGSNRSQFPGCFNGIDQDKVLMQNLSQLKALMHDGGYSGKKYRVSNLKLHVKSKGYPPLNFPK